MRVLEARCSKIVAQFAPGSINQTPQHIPQRTQLRVPQQVGHRTGESIPEELKYRQLAERRNIWDAAANVVVSHHKVLQFRQLVEGIWCVLQSVPFNWSASNSR
jgi:hypothetical protein